MSLWGNELTKIALLINYRNNRIEADKKRIETEYATIQNNVVPYLDTILDTEIVDFTLNNITDQLKNNLTVYKKGGKKYNETQKMYNDIVLLQNINEATAHRTLNEKKKMVLRRKQLIEEFTEKGYK